MGEVKNEKMSYEQLENIAHQMSEQSRNLYSQNKQLANALEEANMSNFFKKLDYLWAIIHSDSVYLTEDFKVECGKEFMDMMTTKEEVKEETKE
jgi:predicted metalloendopeptidase